MAPQKDSRMKVSAVLRVGHKVSEVANLSWCLAQSSMRLKKLMDKCEGVDKSAGSGWKTVVDHDSLRDGTRGTASLAGCHSRDSLQDAIERQQPFDYGLHVCWHLRHCPSASWSRRRLYETDKVCDITHFVFRTKKCRNFQSIVSLRSHFEIHNVNQPFSSTPQSQSIGCLKQKPDNNW